MIEEEEGFDFPQYDRPDLLAHVGSLHSPLLQTRHLQNARINMRR
jgi:hypothetical protein